VLHHLHVHLQARTTLQIQAVPQAQADPPSQAEHIQAASAEKDRVTVEQPVTSLVTATCPAPGLRLDADAYKGATDPVSTTTEAAPLEGAPGDANIIPEPSPEGTSTDGGPVASTAVPEKARDSLGEGKPVQTPGTSRKGKSVKRLGTKSKTQGKVTGGEEGEEYEFTFEQYESSKRIGLSASKEKEYENELFDEDDPCDEGDRENGEECPWAESEGSGAVPAPLKEINQPPASDAGVAPNQGTGSDVLNEAALESNAAEDQAARSKEKRQSWDGLEIDTTPPAVSKGSGAMASQSKASLAGPIQDKPVRSWNLMRGELDRSPAPGAPQRAEDDSDDRETDALPDFFFQNFEEYLKLEASKNRSLKELALTSTGTLPPDLNDTRVSALAADATGTTSTDLTVRTIQLRTPASTSRCKTSSRCGCAVTKLTADAIVISVTQQDVDDDTLDHGNSWIEEIGKAAAEPLEAILKHSHLGISEELLSVHSTPITAWAAASPATGTGPALPLPEPSGVPTVVEPLKNPQGEHQDSDTPGVAPPVQAMGAEGPCNAGAQAGDVSSAELGTEEVSSLTPRRQPSMQLSPLPSIDRSTPRKGSRPPGTTPTEGASPSFSTKSFPGSSPRTATPKADRSRAGSPMPVIEPYVDNLDYFRDQFRLLRLVEEQNKLCRDHIVAHSLGLDEAEEDLVGEVSGPLDDVASLNEFSAKEMMLGMLAGGGGGASRKSSAFSDTFDADGMTPRSARRVKRPVQPRHTDDLVTETAEPPPDSGDEDVAPAPPPGADSRPPLPDSREAEALRERAGTTASRGESSSAAVTPLGGQSPESTGEASGEATGETVGSQNGEVDPSSNTASMTEAPPELGQGQASAERTWSTPSQASRKGQEGVGEEKAKEANDLGAGAKLRGQEGVETGSDNESIKAEATGATAHKGDMGEKKGHRRQYTHQRVANVIRERRDAMKRQKNELIDKYRQKQKRLREHIRKRLVCHPGC
jgi:hypothetical protein